MRLEDISNHRRTDKAGPASYKYIHKNYFALKFQYIACTPKTPKFKQASSEFTKILLLYKLVDRKLHKAGRIPFHLRRIHSLICYSMQKAVINSLPKAGTNLVARILDLSGYTDTGHIGPFIRCRKVRNLITANLGMLTTRERIDCGIDRIMYQNAGKALNMFSGLKDDEYITAHLNYNDAFIDACRKNNITILIVIRDPRSVLSSFVFYTRKHKKHKLHKKMNSVPFEEACRIALEGGTYDGITHLPFRERCEAIEKWRSCAYDKLLVLKFEDIVGAQGGGSDEKREQCLENIFASLSIPDSKKTVVRENLFGSGRYTFRSGQIDSWKEDLPASIIQQCESDISDYLRLWGYEQG